MAVTIARTQGPLRNTAATTSVFTITATVANRRLVAILAMKADTSFTTVTDSGGGTWNLVSGATAAVSGQPTRVEIWECLNASAGATTISATSGASNAKSLTLYELTGDNRAVASTGAGAADAVNDTSWLVPTLPALATGSYLLIAGVSHNATASRTAAPVQAGWAGMAWGNGSATLQGFMWTSLAVTGDGSTTFPLTITASAAQINGGAMIAVPDAATGATTHPLTSGIVSTSSVSVPRLQLEQPLASSISAASTVAVSRLQITHPFTASIIGSTTASATALRLDQPLSSAIGSTSAAMVTTIAVESPLAAAVATTSLMTALRIDEEHPLIAGISGSSLVAGALSDAASEHNLIASVMSSSAASVVMLQLAHPLEASIAGVSGLSASLKIDVGKTFGRAVRVKNAMPVSAIRSMVPAVTATRMVNPQMTATRIKEG